MQEGCNLNSQALWDLLISSQCKGGCWFWKARGVLSSEPGHPGALGWASWAAAAGITSGRVRPWMQLTKNSQCKVVVSQGDGLEQGWITRELLMARTTLHTLWSPHLPGREVFWGTDIASVMGDLEQEKPQQAKRASGSRKCLQQRGRTVLYPITGRTCTWGISGTSLLQD